MSPRRAVPVLLALLVAGFVGLGWSWHAARHARYVPLEAPWVISGGLGGIAVIGLAAVSAHIYLGRREDEAHAAAWHAFVRDAIDAVALRPSPKARGASASRRRAASR